MNYFEAEIMNALGEHPGENQRRLAERTGFSVGLVNKSLRALREAGLAGEDGRLTAAGEERLAQSAPRRAVILAAGFGMRMVPIGREVPKALLKVKGEVLIERVIRQLRAAGVREIAVVVGFLKERFEYLIDDFGVELIVNDRYASANNLHSLRRALGWVDNCYIVPCDLYLAENVFRRRESGSWYMVSDREDPESEVRVNRKNELIRLRETGAGNGMIGIAYLTGGEAAAVRQRVAELAADPRYEGCFWEEALYRQGRMLLPARVVAGEQVVEINTYEQLRELDSDSGHLRSDAIDRIAGALGAEPAEIRDITVLKKGMTNRSFLFTCRGKRYIMRIPGEGTEKLISRRQEAACYEAIRGLGLCDPVILMDPENGYKITAYLEGARTCDPENGEEVRLCMATLRRFHERRLRVPHRFDLFGQINFYESLWAGAPSVYGDYPRVKARVLALRDYIARHAKPDVLTHIDAVPDNFLLLPGADGGTEVRLIDWEYAGMQDPDVDLAMFIIYALYDRERAEALVDAYYPEGCPETTRTKIWCYVSVCGLLWSNWCEYKRSLGVEFGEYALRQYRYAKDYCRLARERILAEEGEGRRPE